MSWVEYNPFKPKSVKVKASDAPATISCSLPGKSPSRIIVVLRGAPGWFSVGSKVAVAFGDGQHAGQMLISREGNFRVAKSSKRTNSAMLVMPLPEWVKAEQHFAEPVEMTVGDDGIVLNLPAWARKPDAAPVAEKKGPAVVPATKQPWSGVGSRGPDPVVSEASKRRSMGL